MATLVVETLTIAAYVFFSVVAGLEVSTLFLASVKDSVFFNFHLLHCCCLSSTSHLEHSLEYAKCLPLQLVHAISF